MMDLSHDERAALGAVPVEIVSVAAGQPFLRAGDRHEGCFLVLDGFVSTSKEFPDGKRQIVSLHFPGDMPALMSHPDAGLDVDVVAISACRLAAMSAMAVLDVGRRFPRIGDVFWEHALAMASIQREWIVNLGHRPATSRLAHLLCEIMTRLEALGLAGDKSCDLPFTQVHLSQATGLSRIHMNRSCQELKRQRLISLEQGRLTIHDWDALARLGQFSPDYLCLPPPRRIPLPDRLQLHA